MNTLQPHKIGLVLALFLGGWHTLWAILVAVGWAQKLLDFIFWLHFIKPVYVIEGFSPGIALLLVAVTATIGYVIGWGFSILWNKLHN